MKNNFYVTTPIYYVNDKPHIGHAYTTVLADVLARFNRSLGVDTFFLTGTDEHGQKVEKAAKEHNMTPQQQCDETVIRFQALWDKLEITHDKFIRTTDDNHKTVVRQILQDLFDRGLIYKAEYKGHYCVPCERFYTDKDFEEGTLCPECHRATSEIIESNYFFRMSQYQTWLIEYINNHPDFIQPAFRANETLGFLKKPLGDLCISRPKERLAWGIEMPFDADYVCYVWFDALINYISGIGYGSDGEEFNKRWPASYHLIGKDILTTHTVYWPTMLKAIGIELPKTIFAHGWWLVGRDKMSKSLGNVVNPMDMAEKYGVDAFRYFLMAEMSLGQDASFTEMAFINRYNSDLANDLGNMLSRTVKMIMRQCEWIIPAPGVATEPENELTATVDNAIENMSTSLRDMKLEQGIESIMNAVRACNRYMEKTAPWTLAKKGETERLNTVMYYSADALWKVSVLMDPVMPGKMLELRNALGIDQHDIKIAELSTAANCLTGHKVNDTGALFQRIVVEDKQQSRKGKPFKQEKKAKQEQQPSIATVAENAGLVTIDEFFKTELKTAKVIDAERIAGTDKLLKLQIDVGGEARQLVAGIAQFYSPEEIIGKTVVVVANLQPAKIRGVESNGMLLAAKDNGKLTIVTTDGYVSSGVAVG